MPLGDWVHGEEWRNIKPIKETGQIIMTDKH